MTCCSSSTRQQQQRWWNCCYTLTSAWWQRAGSSLLATGRCKVQCEKLKEREKRTKATLAQEPNKNEKGPEYKGWRPTKVFKVPKGLLCWLVACCCLLSCSAASNHHVSIHDFEVNVSTWPPKGPLIHDTFGLSLQWSDGGNASALAVRAGASVTRELGLFKCGTLFPPFLLTDSRAPLINDGFNDFTPILGQTWVLGLSFIVAWVGVVSSLFTVFILPVKTPQRKGRKAPKHGSKLQRQQKWSRKSFFKAFVARRCSTHRMSRARLKHRRIALRLRSRWFRVHRRRDPKKPAEQGVLPGFPFNFDWSPEHDNFCDYSPVQPTHEAGQWLGSECLRGGSGYRRKRKRNPKRGPQVSQVLVKTLIQGLKTCLNQGSFPTDLSPLFDLLGSTQFADSSAVAPAKKRVRKRKTQQQSASVAQTKPKTSTTQKELWTFRDGTTRPYCRNTETGWWWWDDSDNPPFSSNREVRVPPHPL